MEIKVIENQFFLMEYFCGALSVGLSPSCTDITETNKEQALTVVHIPSEI